MSPWLLGLTLTAMPDQGPQLADMQAPGLQPSALVLPHGPDGPDDVPDEGYEFKEDGKKKKTKKDKKIFLKVGAGLVGTSAITALAANSQKAKLESTNTILTEQERASIEDTRQTLRTTSLVLVGSGVACLGLEFVF